jgi:hypothetical protein
MRTILDELDARGAAGAQVQRQLVTEMVAAPVGNDAQDPAAAARAQAALRKAAIANGILEDAQAIKIHESEDVRRRRDAAARQSRSQAERRTILSELHAEYLQLLVAEGDRQARGYRLEEIMGQLATLEELRYTPPFRKGTVTQTDGMIGYDGFHYLLEARWREKPPDAQALGAFIAKIARNLQSTRGLFVSIAGYRDEVIAEMQSGIKNLVLMSGQEFELILDQRITLAQALQEKIEHGAKKGEIFYDLALRY